MNPFENGPKKPIESEAKLGLEELKQAKDDKIAPEENEGQVAMSGKKEVTKEDMENHYRRMRKFKMGGPNRRSQESRKAIIEKQKEEENK